MIYELAYSLCVMILTCPTLCLIIHMNCMSGSRTRVKVAVRHPFGFANMLACQSVGLESQRVWVVSMYANMVLGYGETGECISYSPVEG